MGAPDSLSHRSPVTALEDPGLYAMVGRGQIGKKFAILSEWVSWTKKAE